MGDDSLKSFEDLQCWQACRAVRIFITELVKSYPKEEQYSLVDNMKRAARSTTQNIAEGFGRFHFKENLQFCRISRGSLFELTDDLITSIDEGFICKEDYNLGRKKIANALALLNGYIKYLNGKANPSTNNQ
ncbi:MAG: four helix bundle protein [Desulfobacterales bacterium]|jgi:four helix bundle protein